MSTSDQERAVDAPIPDTKDGSGDGSGAATEPADGATPAKTDGAPSAPAPRAAGEAAPAEGPGTATAEKTTGKAAGKTAGEAGEETGDKGPGTVGGPAPAAAPDEDADDEDAVGGDSDDGDDDGRRLTPRQARRLRMVLSAVGMAAMAVVLVLRIASRSSVLVVGVYGLALILCGIVIELSRNGRTRLGSWLLAVGLVAAIGSDWLLIP
ncbi:hypothetical protein ACFV1C_07700 [Streptomyces sp. NPDC059605]|uniref:hypothetical protein n=1 Tax=unclassified Streptomyces TaxID=2593676 RepID=UPI0036AC724C